MKKTFIKISMVLIAATMPHVVVAQQTGTASTLTGGIEVTKSAINQIETELAEQMAKTKLNATDYKRWTALFQVGLNDVLGHFLERIEKEIVIPQQTFVDQYNQILQDPGIKERPDQASTLKTVQKKKLDDKAKSLEETYRAIYWELVKNSLAWLPTPQVKQVKLHGNKHLLMNILKVGVATTYFGIAWVGSSGLTRAKCVAEFRYQLASFDGKIIYPEIHQSLIPFDRKCDESMKAVDELSIIENASDQARMFMREKFAIPVVSEECASQVCLSLKQSDFRLTMEKIAERLDRPFEFTFSDGARVSINAPGKSLKWYLEMLKEPITNPDLPFDTSQSR